MRVGTWRISGVFGVAAIAAGLAGCSKSAAGDAVAINLDAVKSQLVRTETSSVDDRDYIVFNGSVTQTAPSTYVLVLADAPVSGTVDIDPDQLDGFLSTHAAQMATAHISAGDVVRQAPAFRYVIDAPGQAEITVSDHAVLRDHAPFKAVKDGFVIPLANRVAVSDARVDGPCALVRANLTYEDIRQHAVYQGYGAGYLAGLRVCPDKNGDETYAVQLIDITGET